VGAQPPESSSISGHEGMRLKGMLVNGKKRGREDDREAKKAPSDDEDESRTGAIKKKTRPDPLEFGAKKKHGMEDGSVPTTHERSSTRHLSIVPDDVDMKEMVLHSPVVAEPSPHRSHKKKRKKKDHGDEVPVQLGILPLAT
jgi:hypothetical protein